jgi:Ca-activated chloride channel homolog
MFNERHAPGIAVAFLVLVPVLYSQNNADRIDDNSSSSSVAALDDVTATLKKQVREVSLTLSVTDRKGRFVGGLLPSDLTILDNGTRQNALTYFESQTDLPLHVALLLDISSSVAYRFEAEKDALKAFLKRVTRPPDSAFLFGFNERVQLIVPVTDNWKEISRSLKTLKPDGKTALYDAVSEVSHWLGRDRQPARKIIILVTDGEENNSKQTLEGSIADVLEAESSIYTVNISNDTHGLEAKEAQRILKRLSDATGGNYLEASTDRDVSEAFGKIQRELRSQYVVAYKPSSLADQLFHRLQVIAPRDLRVRCRTGYYAK